MDPDLFLEICLALCFCLSAWVAQLLHYGRFIGFSLNCFFYMAVAPLALSTYAGPHEIGHTGSSWVRTFLCALFEMTGIMLMMRLGTILINAGGLFPTASEDILGGMLGSQGWEGLQAILGILIITGSVSGTDAMVRRAFGF